jgi:hypothetical protein
MPAELLIVLRQDRVGRSRDQIDFGGVQVLKENTPPFFSLQASIGGQPFATRLPAP